MRKFTEKQILAMGASHEMMLREMGGVYDSKHIPRPFAFETIYGVLRVGTFGKFITCQFDEVMRVPKFIRTDVHGKWVHTWNWSKDNVEGKEEFAKFLRELNAMLVEGRN